MELGIKKDNNSSKINNQKNSFKDRYSSFEYDSKLEFLTKEEIEAYYCLLGLLYYNIDVRRKYKITSIESIYGIFIFIKNLS
jgi:hypothetical protein